MVRISKIIAWPGGITVSSPVSKRIITKIRTYPFDQDDGDLRPSGEFNPQRIDKSVVERLARLNLGVRDSSNGLYFLKNHGIQQMNDFLREMLPYVFEFMAIKNPWILTIDGGSDDSEIKTRQMPYILLYYHRNALKIAGPEEHSTAERYVTFKGRSGANFVDCGIWIGVSMSLLALIISFSEPVNQPRVM